MRGCFKFHENPAVVTLCADLYHFIAANIDLVISDDRAGKASHTLCYLIFRGFKRRQCVPLQTGNLAITIEL